MPDLSGIDADRKLPGHQALVFGTGTGKGTIYLEDDAKKDSTDTILYVNVDRDSDPEMLIRISDGRSNVAGEYTAVDFVLS